MDDEPLKPPGFIYTFYSYKGGVGRSMAMVNTGVLLALAEGADKKPLRILLVDWDLEAPGLEVHFQKCEQVKLKGDPQTVPGIVDLLEAHAEKRDLPWRDCLLTAEFAGVSLDLMSSGAKSPKGTAAKDYRQRVQQLDWAALFEKHDIGNYLDRLRTEWLEAYDFVLIDSRTGITDIGDICTVLLPDALVLFFVSNYQNIDGVIQTVERARAARSKLPVDRSRLIAVPVPARDETSSEYDKSMEWRRIYAEKLGHLYKDWLPRTVQPMDALSRLYIPYVTNWSFGERIPVLESARERSDPTTIGAAYLRLANLLGSRLDWAAVTGEASEALAGTQAELGVERSKSAEFEVLLMDERRRRRFLYGILGFPLAGVAAYSIWAQFIANTVVTGATGSPINDAAFSPDGLRIATAHEDATAHIWDAATGKEIAVLKGHQAIVYHIAWSPDGTRLATASEDKTGRVWDAATAKEIAVLKGHEGSVWDIDWSPDGARLATQSDDKTGRVWDATSGKQIAVLKGHEGIVNDIAWSPDGTRLATASEDNTARLWDAVTAKEIAVLKGHEGNVWDIDWNPDGTRLATASDDKTGRVWDATSGKQIAVLKGHEGIVNDIAWSPDGTRLATASEDNTARLATASEDNTARLWDPVTAKEIAVLKGHEAEVTRIAWNPDKTRLATASQDNSTRLWDANTGVQLRVFDQQKGAITVARFSPNGQRLLSASTDGSFMIFDL